MTPSVVVVVEYDATAIAKAAGLHFYGGGTPDTWVDMDVASEDEAMDNAHMLFGERVFLPAEWRRTHPFVIGNKPVETPKQVRAVKKTVTREDALANRGMKKMA